MVNMLKTTALGGIVFLLPFGILLLVLSEVLGFATGLVEPIVALFPKDDYIGMSLAGLLAVFLILLISFLAGVAARYAAFSGYSSKAHRFLTDLIPGYGMMRTRIAATFDNEAFAVSKQVVTVKIGGLKRFAFLIEEWPETGEAMIFLPGSPNAEAGILGTVPLADLTLVDISPHKILRAYQFYGRGLKENGSDN